MATNDEEISRLCLSSYSPPTYAVSVAILQVKFLEFNYCACYHDDTVKAICCTDKGKVFSTGSGPLMP
jgi:hypothetical protein